MIDFRYHLVSIIAVFFALAAGIVLGAGPLGDTVDDTLAEQTSSLRDENRELREQLEATEADTAYQQAFLEEVTPRLVTGQLDGENVGIIALPGADEDTVAAVRETLQTAGATADLTVRVEPTWTDPDSEPVLDELATELVASGTELPADGDGYARGAAVLAAALMAAPAEAGAETIDTATVTAFEESDLITLEQDASVAPSLAVLVAGNVSGDDAEDRLNRLATLVTGIDAAEAGTVVAGPAQTAEDGLLRTIRDNGDIAELVSTVDSVDLPSGRAAVVFALSEQAEGGSGQYGVVGETDGALPPVPEEPGASVTDEATEGSSS
ncbi:copper transporter [Jiangella alkaliphila]|uniref:Copper transport outer membrane protein, MctB n=1 Tax=Jiangella alkaliphila TaxID=419479 RepID=A0A1H2KEH0_9ACTN|nr:copper transporter [Jiangella alkaliphila]SDU66982.1 Copper transport outer membrane protein, MctB [Jiangella alkaliphila]